MFFFFFNDTATTEIYTLSLHDALPISQYTFEWCVAASIQIMHNLIDKTGAGRWADPVHQGELWEMARRSEEHTPELQSRQYLVCRLLLEKKKKKQTHSHLVT